MVCDGFGGCKRVDICHLKLLKYSKNSQIANLQLLVLLSTTLPWY